MHGSGAYDMMERSEILRGNLAAKSYLHKLSLATHDRVVASSPSCAPSSLVTD
jgi:hypothetical protein